MIYLKYKPRRELEKYVECFFIWEGKYENPISIESPPTGLGSLVFNYQQPYAITNRKYRKKLAPNCFLCGQAMSNYTFHITGQIGVVGIAFKPSAIHHFFGVPMYELTDERICFSKISSASCDQMLAAIRTAKKKKDKIEIIEAYLLTLIQEPDCGEEFILRCANTIFEQKGRTNIGEMIDSAPMSRRNFERKFLEEVGVSPKTYAKIRRFGYTCSLMAGNRNVNFMDVLHEGGYYDQSHFIKDFKYFSGRTPRRYAKTNVELANYVDGISLVERRIQEAMN